MTTTEEIYKLFFRGDIFKEISKIDDEGYRAKETDIQKKIYDNFDEKEKENWKKEVGHDGQEWSIWCKKYKDEKGKSIHVWFHCNDKEKKDKKKGEYSFKRVDFARIEGDIPNIFVELKIWSRRLPGAGRVYPILTKKCALEDIKKEEDNLQWMCFPFYKEKQIVVESDEGTIFYDLIKMLSYIEKVRKEKNEEDNSSKENKKSSKKSKKNDVELFEIIIIDKNLIPKGLDIKDFIQEIFKKFKDLQIQNSSESDKCYKIYKLKEIEKLNGNYNIDKPAHSANWINGEAWKEKHENFSPKVKIKKSLTCDDILHRSSLKSDVDVIVIKYKYPKRRKSL